MPILRAELIRGEVEFRYRIRNDRRVVSRHAEVVVVHAVHRKVVVARTRSANRSADSRHSARLRYNVGRQHRQVQQASIQCARAARKVDRARIK